MSGRRAERTDGRPCSWWRRRCGRRRPGWGSDSPTSGRPGCSGCGGRCRAWSGRRRSTSSGTRRPRRSAATWASSAARPAGRRPRSRSGRRRGCCCARRAPRARTSARTPAGGRVAHGCPPPDLVGAARGRGPAQPAGGGAGGAHVRPRPVGRRRRAGRAARAADRAQRDARRESDRPPVPSASASSAPADAEAARPGPPPDPRPGVVEPQLALVRAGPPGAEQRHVGAWSLAPLLVGLIGYLWAADTLGDRLVAHREAEQAAGVGSASAVDAAVTPRRPPGGRCSCSSCCRRCTWRPRRCSGRC